VILEPRQRTRPLLRTTLGEVLRRIRLEQERTLADVASSARVSLPYLSEIERGRKEASSEVLAALCEALGIELSDLLADVRRELAPERAEDAVVIRLGSAGDANPANAGPVAPAPGPAQSGRGSGDVVCLLAA
jgi:transcriptional regulator with XRE-family HTH domain